MDRIQQYAEVNGYTYWQAKYALEKSRRDPDTPYTPHPRKGWTVEEFDQLGITIEPADNDYGWQVYRNGRKHAIFVTKGTVYKDGGCKYYPSIVITNNYKPKLISLAVVIWVGYLKRDIPAGYVVDHIDNDSFNNDISNLQLLTIRQNVEKNPAKKSFVKEGRRSLQEE